MLLDTGELTLAGFPPAAGAKFIDHLLSFNFVEADWVNPPGGLSAWYKSKKGAAFASGSVVNSLDMFTSKDVVAHLGEFIHQILVALGASSSVEDVSAEGYTFKDWTGLNLEHLEMTLALPTLTLQPASTRTWTSVIV